MHSPSDLNGINKLFLQLPSAVVQAPIMANVDSCNSLLLVSLMAAAPTPSHPAPKG